MKARESCSQQSDSVQAMVSSEDNTYWDYYYSQPPYSSPYWSVNMMASVDRASRSQEPGDLLKPERKVVISLVLPPQGLSLVVLQTINAGIGTYGLG